ncbi:SDR family NAD(P)-dependent oxidoreductase [Paracoccaceae bacterium]|nr:SDR family NAD(P)-dependent oxidoreductase [Paracoccaceae bacterium]
MKKEKKLLGKLVLVTGASSGLGFEISKVLAEEGAHVIAVGRKKNRLEKLSDEIASLTGSSTLVPLDLNESGAIEELSHQIYTKFKSLDIIIHCAMSTLPMMPINQVSLKDIEINLVAPVTASLRLILCFHDLLKNNSKGIFFYISDKQAVKFNGIYNAAKSACDKIFESYREENKRLNIDVCVHYPDSMDTKLKRKLSPGYNKNGQTSPRIESIKIRDKILRLTKSKRIFT